MGKLVKKEKSPPITGEIVKIKSPSTWENSLKNKISGTGGRVIVKIQSPKHWGRICKNSKSSVLVPREKTVQNLRFLHFPQEDILYDIFDFYRLLIFSVN